MKKPDIQTLGALRASGYRSRSIKDELRENLILALRGGKGNLFPTVHGFDETVIPELERAILSRHNILLLGLRGQAKTRIARLMLHLLDEWIPVIEGSELNEDPMQPLTRWAKEKIAAEGDATPVTWMHRDERFGEKLATPDVSVADLIGDVDPIKAANLRLSYSDERVIHFGLVPRSHRCLFVINELPDLQARIQVSLFNILQEGDIQIRGFRLRIPLDIQFVFTANPEDYTNRGSIVTPLKDRIESQILTHYPRSLETGMRITEQEAQLADDQKKSVYVPKLLHELVERVAMEARKSEYVDQKSGVSARLTISAMENLVSAAERRMLLNAEKNTLTRMGDLSGILPSITGKIELVYEGEQEGPAIVAQNLIDKAIRTAFLDYFPDPAQFRKKPGENPYTAISRWFGKGNQVSLESTLNAKEYSQRLQSVPGLKELLNTFQPQVPEQEREVWMEFLLHGLAGFSLIGKSRLDAGLAFSDLLSGILPGKPSDDEEEGEEEDF